jgi:hypothetical protein
MSDPSSVRCPHCGGGDVLRGLELNQNAEVGKIGLPHKAALVFTGTEPLLADLCRGCGTVVRLYVRETSRKWIQAS